MGLFPQPPHQLADRDAEFAGETGQREWVGGDDGAFMNSR
ncbi:uncharacterized protein BCN122_II1482 [Burkholderia cenocepacia]|nr:uncharacterized protein BCN122_II1482 [Burkholderia cenocepacia]